MNCILKIDTACILPTPIIILTKILRNYTWHVFNSSHFVNRLCNVNRTVGKFWCYLFFANLAAADSLIIIKRVVSHRIYVFSLKNVLHPLESSAVDSSNLTPKIWLQYVHYHIITPFRYYLKTLIVSILA